MTAIVTKTFDRSIWWIKRDIRLTDNDALLDAIATSNAVLPLYIFEPSLCRAKDTSAFHCNAVLEALADLSARLELLNVSLITRVGEVDSVFEAIYSSDPFQAIFSHEETGNHLTYQRDIRIEQWCKSYNVSWKQLTQTGVIRCLRDRHQRQAIIKKRLFDTEPRSAPTRWQAWLPTDQIHKQTPLPCLNDLPVDQTDAFRAGSQLRQITTETQAYEDLNSFLEYRGLGYAGGISSPNTAFAAGSRLSTHLAYGTMSLRNVFHASQNQLNILKHSQSPEVKQWKKSLRAFQSRLHWHDHFIQRLESYPLMEFQALNPAYRDLPYEDDESLLQAWHSGNTGMPLVDACMRCLCHTGFLNFRMRAMVVTTACFGLKQSWLSIHPPLAGIFLDYEPGIHLSQVQMQAGIVGINTLRVYSPHKQLLDHDPNCEFVKRWVPELREFSAEDIANYEKRQLGSYPAPIADIKTNARHIKDAIQAIRKSDEGKAASAQVLEKHGSKRSPDRRKRTPAEKRSGIQQADKDLNQQQQQLRLEF